MAGKNLTTLESQVQEAQEKIYNSLQFLVYTSMELSQAQYMYNLTEIYIIERSYPAAIRGRYPACQFPQQAAPKH